MRSLCARFAGDRRGNFGVVTAVIVVPVLMAAGLSVDIATIEKTRTDLQQAMDSAALAIAREGKDIPGDEAEAIARQFLAGNFAADYTKLGLARDGTAITVKADTLAKLNFASLFGFDTWPVEAASTADIAYASYEIGLVLDTTGSMAGGKLASMKDAVLGLIDGMTAEQDDPDRLKFALVPFATFVNVGPQFAPSFDDKGKLVKGSGAKWLDLKGDSPIPELELQPGVSRF
jgi:Flp pilus assembly protein TadG